MSVSTSAVQQLPAIFTASELFTTNLPGPNLYAIDGMIQRNNPRPSLLVGLPRAGKSTLATQMAVTVATGREFLERKTQQGHVIFWKSEDSPERTHASFKKAGLPSDADVSFIFSKRLPHGFDKAATLRAELAKFPETVLVVIETLGSYMGGIALNEAKDIIAAFDKFHSDVMRHYPKAAYLFLHQFNKDPKGTDKAPRRTMMRVNGSVFLSAEAACTIYLDQASDEDKRRTIFTEGREGDTEIDQFTYLSFDETTNTSTLGGTVKDERTAKAKAAKEEKVFDADAMVEKILKQHPRTTKTKLMDKLRSAGLEMGDGAMLALINSMIHDLKWIKVTKNGNAHCLTWVGLGGTDCDLEPEEQSPQKIDPEVESPVEIVPSMETVYKVSGHMSKFLNITDEKGKGRLDVVALNLLAKGRTAESITEVFDYFCGKDKRNEVIVRVKPSEFEKQFDQIAVRMAEGMVAA
jgi:AAA domain